MDSLTNQEVKSGALLKLDEVHLLHALIDLIPDLILVKDIDGRYVWVNRAKIKELGGRELNEIVGRTAYDFFDRAIADAFKIDDELVLKSGQPIVNRREKVIEPDGQIHWHLTTKLPWCDAEGKIIGLISVSRNITEWVEAEMKLHEERNLLRTLVDNLPDAIYAKDLAGRKIIANPVDLHNMDCATEAEALGKTDFDFFPKDIAEQFFAAEQQVLKNGQPLINHEEKIKRPDGQTRCLLTSKIPWRDASGQIVGLVGIGRDITEKKHLEEQVTQAQRMESVGRLATGIAHELNNILTPILISIEIMRKKNQDAECGEMLAKAEASAHRGADILKQMLWFSRSLTGKRGPIHFPQLIGDIAQFNAETFGSSIHVKKEIAPGLWTVIGDTAQLHQVLMNLCTNAREAMPQGGTLTITARNGESGGNRFVILEVADTGHGIAPELADKIFEPFFTTKSLGHGLGLSTAHSIVKNHGGFIKMESRPGTTSFRVHLPAQL